MAGRPWTDAEDARLRELHRTKPTAAEVAAEMPHRSVASVRYRMEALTLGPPTGRVLTHTTPPVEPDGKVEREDGSIELISEPGRIVSLEALLERFEVDRRLWIVERHVINKYEQGAKVNDEIVVTELFQVKAWLKPSADAHDLTSLRDDIIAEMGVHSPTYPAYPEVAAVDDPHMLEVSPFDLHVGKLAWAAETGENYDSGIAGSLLVNAVDDLVRKASGFAIDRILFPVGNDLLHADTPENTTTRGTRQDVDTRPHKMFVAAYKLMVAAIDRLMVLAPVDVIVVPGNHDRDNAMKLGVVLAAHYRLTDRVSVNDSPRLRKYVTYGVSLLGFTHGSEEKAADLPLIMAQEEPECWSRALHKEWHIGHLHKRKATNFTAGDTFNGVVVRWLPSLSGTDAWHFSKGYTKGQRAAEAYLWGFKTGYVGHFSTNVYGRRPAA